MQWEDPCVETGLFGGHVGELLGVCFHQLSLLSSSVGSTCTKGHYNEIYIYNNHNYYPFTNFLFCGWSLAETTEQGKLLKLRVMVPPGRIKSKLQTSRCCWKPQCRKYLQNELGILWCLVCNFYKKVPQAEEGMGDKGQDLTERLPLTGKRRLHGGGWVLNVYVYVCVAGAVVIWDARLYIQACETLRFS